jgi:hypothetical protein
LMERQRTLGQAATLFEYVFVLSLSLW